MSAIGLDFQHSMPFFHSKLRDVCPILSHDTKIVNEPIFVTLNKEWGRLLGPFAPCEFEKGRQRDFILSGRGIGSHNNIYHIHQ